MGQPRIVERIRCQCAVLGHSAIISALRRVLENVSVRDSNENMFLDGEWSGVKGELEEAKEVDILGREGASHEGTEPVGDNLDKEHRVGCSRSSEPRDLRDNCSQARKYGAQHKETVTRMVGMYEEEEEGREEMKQQNTGNKRLQTTRQLLLFDLKWNRR